MSDELHPFFKALQTNPETPEHQIARLERERDYWRERTVASEHREYERARRAHPTRRDTTQVAPWRYNPLRSQPRIEPTPQYEPGTADLLRLRGLGVIWEPETPTQEVR
jgi:hypothetical protein